MNEKFGSYDLSQSITLNIEKLGKNIGLFEKMGSDPQGMVNSLVRHYISILHNQALQKETGLQEMFSS